MGCTTQQSVMMFIRGTRVPLLASDESVKSVINYSISVDSVDSVDYLFSTEDTEGHGGGLTKTKTFNGGCVVSASGRFWERELRECP